MQATLISCNPEEASLLSMLLEKLGFDIRLIEHLDDASFHWPEIQIDLVILVLPDSTDQYIDRLKQIRAHTMASIIIIGEMLPENMQVKMLDAGGDLILQKPYSSRLLAAQIRTAIRRSSGMPYNSLPALTHGKIVLDPKTRTVQVNGSNPKHLTQLEFRLLYVLMIQAGEIIPTEKIVEQVWGYEGEGNKELVRGLVQRLRTKVEPDLRNPKYILTEPGVGYRLAP